jgi:hypothetical protein
MFEEFRLRGGNTLDCGEHGAQVALHGLRGAIGVTRGDAIDYVLVLAEDHRQPVCIFEREMAHPIKLRLHRGNHLPHRFMAGDVQDGVVHCLVECEEPVLVAGLDPLALCGDLPAQRCDLLAGGGLRGAANGKAFQRFADELAVGDSGEIDWRNVSTDLWDHAQQTVLNQALKDLSDGLFVACLTSNR